MSAQFNIRAANEAAVRRLQEGLNLPHFIAVVLASRGIVDVQQAQEFLSPSLDRDWLDPYIIPGMSEAAHVIESAVRENKRIAVFGDFDLDGISATTVLTRGLRAFGAEHVTPFIPRRFDEGYGLTVEAWKRLRETAGPIDLVITVDCGIACRDAVRELREQGVEVVVTDHHEPSDLVPVDVPVCDPKIDMPAAGVGAGAAGVGGAGAAGAGVGVACPSEILAGVGVALKMVQVLGGRFGRPYYWRTLTDIATLGTVADLMPMRGENRALVADGIAQINAHPRPCIAALLGSSGAGDKPVTASNLSFSLIPRLNAAGRMGDAQLALDVLMTDDYEEAFQLAEELEQVNDSRRAIEAELSEIAKAEASQTYRDQRALVVAGVGWHEGVKGIVASRLVNQYGVPTLLFSIDGDEARGSGRSVGRVNLFKAVESCADLLTRFGGHEAAVGVTLPAANLGMFAQRLCEYMDTLPADDFHPRVDIDACVNLRELTLETVAQLEMLAPFGQENQVPCLLARDVTLANRRAVGAEKNHLSCNLTDGRATVAGIMFHCSEIEELMTTDSVVNAAFQVQIDEWRGRKSVKAMLKSLQPARMCGALAACLDSAGMMFVSGLYESDDAELCADAIVSPEEASDYEAQMRLNRRIWEAHGNDVRALRRAVTAGIIGRFGQLHESQKQVLDYLDQGQSTLAVMATGRGKSLIFQVHAALRALVAHQASLFVYPLRALITDQSYHLARSLEPFGIRSAVLTGDTSPDQRARIMAGLADGSVDIVLTTPEYLCLHSDQLAESRRIGFVVIDEAHHVGQAKAGNRMAYAQIGTAISKLGDPLVLALTATATDGIAQDIMQTLPIQQCVFDDARRDNLVVDDQRNLRSRDDYLANLVATGEKTVVYVNSREQSVAVARMLRKRVPQLAPLIGFYNAGLAYDERKRVEELFRNDVLTVLVATSAFGEGVNIPNIRHVVLYHLPFNEVEFNQMSGRAGRDGNQATIHLLFSRNDAAVNEGILQRSTPDRDTMAQVYRRLRQLQREASTPYFSLSDSDLDQVFGGAGQPVAALSALCGLDVFRELGLIETHKAYTGGHTTRAVHVVDGASRVELTDSVRYQEGLGERLMFQAFRDWIMAQDAPALRLRIIHPIIPDNPDLPRGM